MKTAAQRIDAEIKEQQITKISLLSIDERSPESERLLIRTTAKLDALRMASLWIRLETEDKREADLLAQL